MKIKINKNWKKHFLEFLMLFLAVFLGFLADNLLVNITHNKQEKDYIKSLIVDVRSDKLDIKSSIELNQLRIKQFDSLSKLCYTYHPSDDEVKNIYQYYMLVLGGFDMVKPSNRTISQLKSTGAMRLIKNKESINAIMDYERQKYNLVYQGTLYLQNHQKLRDLGLTIFNYSKFYILHESFGNHNAKLEEIKLIKDDKSTIIKLANISTISKFTLRAYVALLKRTNKEADSLINTLRTNYNLK